MPDATIGWGGPSVSGVLGNPNAAAALAPSIAAPMGSNAIAAMIGNLGSVALGSNQAANNLGWGAATSAPPGSTVSSHGWGAPVSTLSNLSPEQSAALSQALGVVSTMNTNQAAINDAIAMGQTPVGVPNQTSQDAYGYTSLAQGPPAADPNSVAAALAEAQGYADSQASPTGYGYGLSGLSSPAAQEAMGYSGTVSAPMGYGYGVNANQAPANTADADTAAAVADAQGYSDSQSADTGYGYGLSLGAPASTSEGEDDGGDDAGDAGDGGDGGY